MNRNWKLDLYKNRDKIAIGAGIVVAIIVILCLIFVFFGNDKADDFFVPKTDYANYYVAVENNNIVLYNVAGEKKDELKFDRVVYPKHLGAEMIVYADGNFYKITAHEKEQTTVNSTNCALKKELILKYENKSIVEFVWTDKHIAVKRENGTVELYDRETEKSIYLENLPLFNDFLIISDYFIYTIDDTIGSININNKESTIINVGAETYGLIEKDGKLFAFNKFGHGKNTTSIFVLNPSNLNIDVLTTESSSKVYPIQSDSCHFVTGDSKLIYSEVGVDGKFNTITISANIGENQYSPANALSLRNYIYLNRGNSIIMISINKKVIQKEININCEYFCPLYVEAR